MNSPTIKADYVYQPEVAVAKQPHENTLILSTKTTASVLLQLDPPTDREAPPEWVYYLQAIARIPSLKADSIIPLVQKAQQAFNPRHWIYKDLQECLDRMIPICRNNRKRLRLRPLEALKVKDKVALILRRYYFDPTKGRTHSTKWLIHDLKQQDRVATPMGIGTLADYRPKDQMCIVLFKWGHGYFHLSKVWSLPAAEEELKRSNQRYLETRSLMQILEQNEPDHLQSLEEKTIGETQEVTSRTLEYMSKVSRLPCKRKHDDQVH